jgi:ketosteroid isomerase-like protein
VARLWRSACLRLPVGSRLRRELFAQATCDGAEAWNRGDPEAFLALVDRDVEFNIAGQFAGVDTDDRYVGHEGGRRYLAAIDDAWETNRLEPQEVIDFGDRSLVLHRNVARGKGSGVEVEHDIGFFMTYRHEIIVRVDLYWSRQEALEAAGLGE